MTQMKRRVLYTKQDTEDKQTTNCKFFPSRSYVNSESPVMCNENDKMNYNGKNKCEHCGWNPLVKAERLRKVYGDKKQTLQSVYLSLLQTELMQSTGNSGVITIPRKENTMYSATTVLGLCFISMLVGVCVALAIILFLFKQADEYVEADDFPDAEWAKTYEEIKKDGH